jgi:hypothetical protein
MVPYCLGAQTTRIITTPVNNFLRIIFTGLDLYKRLSVITAMNTEGVSKTTNFPIIWEIVELF